MDRLPKHLYFSDGAENDVETLFILESPHKEELYWGFPCMGDTGKKMSEILVNDKNIAIGDLIQHNNPQTRKYALFETFKFPLDKSLTHGLDADELFWKKLKNKGDKDQIKMFFEQNRQFFSYSYKYNLECALKIFQRKLKEIVVCGDIAQSIFEVVFEDKLKQEKTPKSVNVIFVEHPAKNLRNSRPWTYKSNTKASLFFSR